MYDVLANIPICGTTSNNNLLLDTPPRHHSNSDLWDYLMENYKDDFIEALRLSVISLEVVNLDEIHQELESIYG